MKVLKLASRPVKPERVKINLSSGTTSKPVLKLKIKIDSPKLPEKKFKPTD